LGEPFEVEIEGELEVAGRRGRGRWRRRDGLGGDNLSRLLFWFFLNRRRLLGKLLADGPDETGGGEGLGGVFRVGQGVGCVEFLRVGGGGVGGSGRDRGGEEERYGCVLGVERVAEDALETAELVLARLVEELLVTQREGDI
jgi:hypothetical protein